MTRLSEAVQNLGVEAEMASSGRLVKIRCERCTVYVADVAWGSEYYTWCDGASAGTVELYATAQDAIAAGLCRAGTPREDDEGNYR